MHYPVYILHQLAIVVIGYWLIQLPLGIAAKFTLLLVLSLGVTVAVYHWIVRPIPALRFALGMKPRVCALRATPLPRAAAAALIVMIVTATTAAWGATPVGRWYAEGGAAQVEIRPCGDALCGYGFVIPRSCIAGVDELTIGFATTILGACVTYVVGLRSVLRDRDR